MSTLSSDESQGQVQTLPSNVGSDALRGALVGLIPLGLLVVLIVIALAVAAFARQLSAAAGFFAQQQAALSVLVAGLALALIVYAVAIVRIMRRVALWQQMGGAVRARAALWALGITALIVILPLLLALVLPQHPAP